VKSRNVVYSVNSVSENHSTVSKVVEVLTLQSKEVVNLTVINNDTNGYSRTEIDALLDNKIDVPAVEDWGNFELILTL